jgi:hypothetical protein
MGVSLLCQLGEPGQLRYAVPVPGTAAAEVVGGLWLLAAVLFVTAAILLVTGRAWRLAALAGVVVSAPVIGLAPGQAAAGLAVDGLVLVLVVVSWLRSGSVLS